MTKIATSTTARPATEPAVLRPDVIAIRKTCDSEGTGLSHFVLMDKEAAK
ncbi:modified peptide precursor CbpA [Rhodopseudomonas rhenobacensis]|uniref:Modified peptide CbpA n=1 Tax=Rhodopseudomonas rhenobacensis TaxID=87461 RepID=A0A7W7Z785_9BRAD|nr:modified peptide precursor CbpA [Rhodopseudomonas rhenobacensis]MBB5048747.1 modified peptide precursor CbpA [Rhodopseudomonas rhenobacensis]